MEVMLERVQFKFASIIGELCSEPLVLSQFAVWVDMRLAEYKLKGSISLDCSGDSPDPIWIKGVTFALKEKLKAAEESAAKAISGVISHRTGVGQDFDRQGRSDSRGRSGSVADGPSLADITQDLHVKPEPIDETSAFPVSLYTNNEKINSPPSSHRKRPIHVSSTHPNSATSSQSYTSEIGEPMPKSSRLSVDEQDLTGSVDPDNTSLLSIIGMNDSQLDSSTNNDNDDDIIECDMTSFQTPSQATSDNPGRLPAAQGSSKQGVAALKFSEANRTGHFNASSKPWTAAGSVRQASYKKVTSTSSVSHCNTLLKNEMPNGDTRPKNVMTEIKEHLATAPNFSDSNAVKTREILFQKMHPCQRTHITILERWLAQNGLCVGTLFETLPPSRLDELLAHFFATVRQRRGDDFTRNSLTSVRTSLTRFLKEASYPYSLTTSPEFRLSQSAFKHRIQGLKMPRESGKMTFENHLLNLL